MAHTGTTTPEEQTMTTTDTTTDARTELVAYIERWATRAENAGIAAREDLIAKCTDGRTGVDLAVAANTIAEQEGAFDAYSEALGNLNNLDRSPADVVLYFANRLAVIGADDGWSGRSNDARRARHDGYREAVSRILDAVRYGA